MRKVTALLLVVSLAITCVFAQSVKEVNSLDEIFNQPEIQVDLGTMLTGYVSEPETPAPVVEETPAIVEEVVSDPYVLETSKLEAFAAGTKADGETSTEGIFTIIWSAKSKVDSSTKTWEDGYTSSQRINLGGKASVKKNSICFTTEGPATVKIWWVQGGEDNRQMAILDAEGAILVSTSGEYTKNSPYYSELTVEAAGTYYLGGATNNNYIFKVEVVPAEVKAESYVLETSTLEAFAAGAKADGDTLEVSDYFTVIFSAKSKVDSSTKTWEDGYTSSQRINLGGKATTSKNSIRFATDGAATVKIWWVQGGEDSRQMALLNPDGAVVAITSGEYTKNSPYYSELTVEAAGTYYLGGATNNNYIFKVEVVPAQAPAQQTYTLETSALEAFAAGAKADGDTLEVADFFTLIFSAKTKVDSSSKTWEDGYASSQRVNFGGKATTSKNSIRFTTTDVATVKIWWVQGGEDNRQMAILNEDGGVVVSTSGEYTKNSPYYSELSLDAAGTYYLGGATNNNYIFKVEVTTGAPSEKPARAAWSTVAAPAIASAVAEGGDITVTVNAAVGYDAADKVSVTMSDAEGAVLETRNSSAEKDSHEMVFTPSSSGAYTFNAVLLREGEADLSAAEAVTVQFTLPLAKPGIKSAANVGDGAVKVAWDAIAEAEKYLVTAGETTVETSELEAVVSGLAIGSEVGITVTSVRGEEKVSSEAFTVKVQAEAETAWAFSAFGNGVSLSTNGYEGNANEGSVRVYSTGGKGKLVPGSTDGVAFYYTEIDPKTQNFKLTATANVNTWTYSNGQEGFGLMAADRVAANGDKNILWNNSYMVCATKVEYTIDGVKNSMRLGVGAQEKAGVTLDNITEAMTLVDQSLFSTTMTTLDTSCLSKGAGTYNLVGNFTAEPTGTIENPRTQFIFTLEKNNTGYFLSYTDPEGKTTTQKYYDPEVLNHLDEEAVYVGFFASRNADVTFTDISFTTSDPATDAAAEERPMTVIDTTAIIASASIANSEDYLLHFYSNADGVVTVKDASGAEVAKSEVKANEKVRLPLKLALGANSFTVTMAPAEGYQPDEYTKLSSYEAISQNLSVNYAVNTAEVVYVGPNGTADAAGTKEAPKSLQSAVNEAVPGQKIVLLAGTYSFSGKLVIERGIDGTAEKAITLMADPDAETRPVIDFGKQGTGMTLAASHWHLIGFDVTNSADGQKGLQVSGSHNTVELVNTYRNGNTGLQISRYKGSDLHEEWPHDNLILNCTSYLNADKGYEDADGFAAKLTIGEGNVFDGCISCYNADDGWDLYAKLETGPIGKVVIKNSVAYRNGYILDENGNEVNAGNGNGFKMGGESITGYHTLINSVSFANKTKGIDSNSCPDIQVQNCTSFDNGSYNVAFYTNTALNTDYSAQGVVSYRKNTSDNESISPKGTQDQSKIYGASNFYFNGGKSVNSEGLQVSDDWFVSLDTAAALKAGIGRNADGSINMDGYLVLTGKAPENVGARL